jgi:dTDP-4-dehydrorhamnose reductase
MKKVLILGASGNLGSCLVQSFADLKPLAWDKVDLDLKDIPALASALEAIKPSLIINAAAYNAVDLCENSDSEFDLAMALNANLPGFLADWCLEREAILVHYSSDYVFNSDKLNFSGFNEDKAPNPVNRYGQSKLLGEKKIMALADKGLNFYLIRTSKLFGPKGMSSGAKLSFFDIMLNLSRSKREIRIVNSERSCFTYTPDLAKATRSLIDNRPPSGIYHLINQGPCTWFKGAQELFKLFNISPKIKEIKPKDLNRPAKRPISSVLINKKRPKLRNWKLALAEFYKKNN